MNEKCRALQKMQSSALYLLGENKRNKKRLLPNKEVIAYQKKSYRICYSTLFDTI